MADGIEQYTDEVMAAIKALVETHWKATPIKWPGQVIEKPEGPYLVVEVVGDVFEQETIGESEQRDNRWDEEGTIWLHLAVPNNTYEPAVIRGAAKAIAEIFRGRVELEGRLEFLRASIGPNARDDGANGNWYVISVSVDWRVMDA